MPIYTNLELCEITWTTNVLKGGLGGAAQLHGQRTLQTWPLLTISYRATSKIEVTVIHHAT